jgi:hypothetical protein
MGLTVLKSKPSSRLPAFTETIHMIKTKFFLKPILKYVYLKFDVLKLHDSMWNGICVDNELFWMNNVQSERSRRNQDSTVNIFRISLTTSISLSLGFSKCWGWVQWIDKTQIKTRVYNFITYFPSYRCDITYVIIFDITLCIPTPWSPKNKVWKIGMLVVNMW